MTNATFDLIVPCTAQTDLTIAQSTKIQVFGGISHSSFQIPNDELRMTNATIDVIVLVLHKSIAALQITIVENTKI